MIFLQSVVKILAVAMAHTFAEGRSDRTRVTVVLIRGDPVGRYIGDHLGRLEECFSRRPSRCSLNITSTSAPERSMVEITPLRVDFDV
jgi:hypothetical protein